MNADHYNKLFVYLEPFLGETCLKETKAIFDQAFAEKDKELECIRANWVLKCDEKDQHIVKLAELLKRGADLMTEHAQRIADLEAIVTDAFKIFDKYLNVPEAHDLRERWAKLKEL